MVAKPIFEPVNKEKIPENQVLSTKCSECIWAKKIGKHQYSCEFGRIERFQKNGGVDKVTFRWTPILDIIQTGKWGHFDLKDTNKYALAEYENNKIVDFYDDFKEKEDIDLEREHSYYKFGRFCNRLRTIYWSGKHKNDGDLKELCIIESKLKVSILIYLGQNDQMFDLENTLHNISEQTQEPYEIIVCNNSSHSPTDVSDLLEFYYGNRSIWRQVAPTQKVSKEQALDETYRYLKGQYFAQIDLPCSVQKDLVEQLDISINERLDRWLMAILENPNIKVFQRQVVKMVNGNVGGNWKGHEVNNIYEKVVAMTEEYNQLELIIKL